ncbi:MAG TPA: chitobiase/beta-hexosaminidase C-terminal domain-containing protein, partial [Ferruginibacter sp.]|nr:chitobiase/beta-hexosaminidase C-terminal domain-containing protein [Ferruginibacter sp.]
GTNFSTAFYDLQSKVISFGTTGIAWELKAKNSKGQIIYTKDKSQSATSNYTQPIPVTGSMELNAALTDSNHTTGNGYGQSFKINKASGKKIILTNAPEKKYAGSGGFTLVDGVQNTFGMNRATQFLGFTGKDLEAVIDLGKSEPIDEIILHAFEQTGSWIYRPASVSFYSSDNGSDFVLLQAIEKLEEKRHLQYSCRKKTTARFIKIMAKNYGVIPPGLPGSGNAAWLFVDEIEVK